MRQSWPAVSPRVLVWGGRWFQAGVRHAACNIFAKTDSEAPKPLNTTFNLVSH